MKIRQEEQEEQEGCYKDRFEENIIKVSPLFLISSFIIALNQRNHFTLDVTANIYTKVPLHAVQGDCTCAV